MIKCNNKIIKSNHKFYNLILMIKIRKFSKNHLLQNMNMLIWIRKLIYQNNQIFKNLHKMKFNKTNLLTTTKENWKINVDIF